MKPRSILCLVIFLTGALLIGTAPPVQAQLAAGMLAQSGGSGQPAADLSNLTAEERAELLARLSDEEVRNLFLGYLDQAFPDQTAEQPAGLVETVDKTMGMARERLAAALARTGEIFEAPGFLVAETSRGLGSGHFYLVLTVFTVIALLAYGVERFYRRAVAQSYARLSESDPDISASKRVGSFLARFGLDLVGIAIFAFVILFLFFVLYRGHEPTRMLVGTLFIALIATRVGIALLAAVLSPKGRSPRVLPIADAAARRLFRWAALAVAFLAFWSGLAQLLQDLGFESEPLLLLRLGGGSLLMLLVLLCLAIARRPVAEIIAERLSRDGRAGAFRLILARQWYLFPALYLIGIYVFSVVSVLAGGAFGSHPAILSLLIILLYPLADFIVVGLVRDLFGPAESRQASVAPIFARAARIVVVLAAVALFFRAWGYDLFASHQGAVLGGRFASAVLQIGATILVAYVLWGLTKLTFYRYAGGAEEEASAGDEGGASAASRLQTIMPLLLRFFQITLIAMVVMIVLSSMGVDIGPLLAGAGVVGIAIGFGAQTLVRDLVSGLFFLLDDAFRKGEYVDIGDVRGSVENINIRSLVLRHHLGPIHTVPFGEIKHLTNFSRDWVIMKLEFRVPTNTDLQKVKKIFKKIGAEMLEHPELGKDFIEPFKSQGVKAIEDSAIIIRGKFMSRPGRQFVIRKELYNRVQAEFQAAGVEFAHRKVTVELPPDAKLSDEQKQKVAEAAGAAARATEEQDDPSKR